MSPKDAWLWWLQRHENNLELVAAISGVNVSTVRRWASAGAVPRNIALLIDQIRHGPALKNRLAAHGENALRHEYRALAGHIATKVRAQEQQRHEQLEIDWGKIWTRNRAFRPGFRLPLPEMDRSGPCPNGRKYRKR